MGIHPAAVVVYLELLLSCGYEVWLCQELKLHKWKVLVLLILVTCAAHPAESLELSLWLQLEAASCA